MKLVLYSNSGEEDEQMFVFMTNALNHADALLDFETQLRALDNPAPCVIRGVIDADLLPYEFDPNNYYFLPKITIG